jgi:hypothetical protein
MKILLLILMGALTLVAAPDTNITGNWSGTFVVTNPSGDTKNSTAFLMLKQTGSEIAGTVGEDEGDQHQIKTGKIVGEKITFLVEDEGRVINFDLVLAGDRINGDVKMSREGQIVTAKLDVTRPK